MTKAYIFTYQSPPNIFRGTLCIKAESIREAQDKFIDWLKSQPTYQHMWQLNFEAKEIAEVIS